MIFVNFKTYKQGSGFGALELVKILRECERESSIPIISVVQVVDARACVRVGTEVWVQHTDLPESIVEIGVKGTFLNHSDHKLDVSRITHLVSQCSEAGLKTLVFAADLEKLRQISTLKPDLVAYEPPELIASPTTSVARARPKVIKEAAIVAINAGIPLVVGAGIKDSNDVKKSLELGAIGVAVSSAVVLAEDPKKVVLELARGFK